MGNQAHSEALRLRYARQIVLPEVGPAGQERLAAARVLIVGLGGLGAPAATYLAAAGVGTLGLAEFDTVDVSNLHRQILYSNADAGRAKIEAAEERLRALNPDLRCVRHPGPFTATNAREIVRGYDLVLDGTDNFAARYAVNDACVLEGVPNVHGAVERFQGQVMVLAGGDAPCYRCLFPEPPPEGLAPSCAEAGVLGVLPGTIGLLQATEALKLILDIGEPLRGRMLRFDALAMSFREVRVRRDPSCPICGDAPTIQEPRPENDACATPVRELEFSIGVDELARRRSGPDAPMVLDVRLPEELALVAFPGDVVHIPMHELPARLDELDPAREYAVLCHHGIRSNQVVRFLRAQGFPGARDLTGGIDRWSAEVDPALPRY